MLDLATPARADNTGLHRWCDAEVFDSPLPHDQTLRAVVLPLGAHKWQWSLSSFEGDRGELISTGVEKTAAAAREAATAEIAKCLEDALA